MPSARLDDLLEELRPLVLDPRLEWVRRFKAASPGRAVVGSIACRFPGELAEATGMLHVALRGGEATDRGAAGVSGLCALGHTTMWQARTEALAPLDLVVLGTGCDPARSLAARLGCELPAARVHSLAPAVTAEQWRQEIVRLGAVLEKASGRPLRPLYLRASLHLLEMQRSLTRQLLALRARRPGTLSIADAHVLVRSGALLPKRRHCEILEEALQWLEGQRHRDRPRARVALVGTACEAPPLALLDGLEAAGLEVVDDDLLAESCDGPSPRPDGDPLTVLAEMMAQAPALAEPRSPADATGLSLRLRRHGAHGVVFAWPAACEHRGLPFADMRAACERERIPYLCIDYGVGTKPSDLDREGLERLALSALAAA